mgnify:CR=1 FL=1
MRIAIDMDEVLADAHGGQRALYADAGFTIDDEDLRGRKLRDVAPRDAVVAVERHLHQGTFFSNLDPMPGATAGLRRLCDTHEVFIATAAMEYPASCGHKVAWVMRHFPFFDLDRLVLCGDKSIIKADVLIDDHARHFDGFGGQGLLFDALHNATVDWPHRLTHWDHAHSTLQEMSA